MTEQRREEEKVPLRLVAHQELLKAFSDDVAFLWCQRQIPVLEQPPTAIEFLRNHVAVSRPCIIRNAFLRDDGFPLTLCLDEIIAIQPDLDLTVDVTPDGHGDCMRLVRLLDTATTTHHEGEQDKVCHCFVKPKTQRMSIQEFRHQLRNSVLAVPGDGDNSPVADRIFETTSSTNKKSDLGFGRVAPENGDNEGACNGVVYYSRQNDCLRQEVQSLWNNDDGNHVLPKRIPWAEEAFRSSSYSSHEDDDLPCPDAVNLWIGNEQAVSSMHKDHYENLFYVLHGEKVFTLCPPSDAPFLYEQLVPSGTFDVEKNKSSSEWRVRLDMVHDDADEKFLSSQKVPEMVQWVTADVTNTSCFDNNKQSSEKKFPLLQYCHPQTVRVRAGEMLYLPALWFHRVTQSCETVGINYWYDMNFESPLWCYFRFVQQLQSEEAIKSTNASTTAAAASNSTTSTTTCRQKDTSS